MSRVFANDPVDQGLISDRVTSKTQKMEINVILLSTQHFKVRIKDKVGQSREGSSAFPDTLV